MLASGCVNPSSNLSYSVCCKASGSLDTYKCHGETDAEGNPVVDSNGYQKLVGCGSSCLFTKNGNIYSNLAPLTAVTDLAACANNCNFAYANCTGEDNKSSCYMLDPKTNINIVDSGGQYILAGPICANATASPCIQNQCTALMCGEPVPQPRGRMDPDSVDRAMADTASGSNIRNSYAQEASTTQQGLVGKICLLQKMDKKAVRLLNAKDWSVNSLRLGVQGTFSDYDRLRYYLPTSDYYCSRDNPNAVVDRFTAYLNGNDKLSVFNGPQGFKTSLSYCEATTEEDPPGSGQFKAVDYYCKVDSRIKFTVAAMGSDAGAFAACNAQCDMNRYKQCSENSPLKLLKSGNLDATVVSPPGVVPQVRYPLVDIYGYAKALSLAYPTPAPGSVLAEKDDPRNYYKKLLQPTDPNYLKEMAKTGPAGAKVFECLDSGDCLSGQCDKSKYQRGSCFRTDGTAVDCGCQYVANCKMAYQCSAMPSGSVQQFICLSNYGRCKEGFGGQDEKDGEVQVACDYMPGDANGAYETYSWDRGLTGGNDGRGTYGDDKSFGIPYLYRFPCYGDTVPNIELANRQILLTSGAPYTDVGDGKSRPFTCAAGTSRAQNCATKRATYAPSIWIGDNCGGKDQSWVGKPIVVLGDMKYAANVKLGTGWMDVQMSPANFRWNTLETGAFEPVFYAVPDKPMVAGPNDMWGGKGLVFSSKWVHFCDNNLGHSLSGLKGTCTETPFGEDCACDYNAQTPPDQWKDVKFKLIQACNMKFGQADDPNADIVLVSPEGSDAGAANIPGAYWGGSGDNVASPWRYIEKTWQIRKFGDCQIDAKGRPVIASYGMCAPCSTMLSVASQNVSKAPNPYCPGGCYDSGEVCDCSSSDANDPKGYPKKAGPDTNPDYRFLTGKINELQSANIIPLLDMRKYDFSAQANFYFELSWFRNCEDYGAILDHTGAFTKTCRSGRYPNPLLHYLATNHSAAIIDVHDLPAAGGSIDEAAAKVAKFKSDCPDCMIALEYPTPIKAEQIHAMPDGYPPALNAAIEQYSADEKGVGVKFNVTRMEMPAEWVMGVPERMRNVSMLVLSVDISSVSTDDQAALKTQMEDVSNLSRRMLQHVGWPTIIKLTYTQKAAGKYTDPNSYKALFDNLRELSLSGGGAILLPPFDNANHEAVGSAYNDGADSPGRLLDSAGVRAEVNTPNTAFCAAQNASTAFLKPRVEVGLQKLYSKSVCSCKDCTALQIAVGQCSGQKALCYDGSEGSKMDKNGKPTGSACDSGTQMCEPYCIRDSQCLVVTDAAYKDLKTTCTAMRASNDPPVECCKVPGAAVKDPPGCRDWPKCDIQRDVRLGELGNDTLRPDASYLLAGLPHTTKIYCAQSPANDPNAPPAKYTYRAITSVSMASEPTLFPAYGSNTTDCGRAVMPAMADTEVACGTPLPPVLDTMWSCTDPK